MVFWTVFWAVVLLCLALGLLVVASQRTIKSIETLMELTNISETAAGFVILAMVSSMGEMVVAIFAIYEDTPGITVGDIFGSHMFNIGVVIGILAIMGFFKERNPHIMLELVDIIFLASIIPLLLLITHFREFGVTGSPFIGIILIVVFVLAMINIARKKRTIEEHLSGDLMKDNQFKKEFPSGLESTQPDSQDNQLMKDELNVSGIETEPNDPSIMKKILGKKEIKREKQKNILKILAGGCVVIIASRIVVSASITIITVFEILPIVIGAKIIAIGTSLPELAFCYSAAKKGKVNLAFGDALGANLTTITLVFGMVLIFIPFTVNLVAFTEIILFVFIMNLLLWRFLVKGRISKTGGIALLFLYIIFQAVI